METEFASSAPGGRPRWNPTVKLVVSIMLIIALILAIYIFRIALIPLIIGGIIAYLMYPLVRRIRNTARLPHGLVTSILYVLIVAIAVPIAIALVPLILRASKYMAQEMIRFINMVENLSPGQTITVLGTELSAQMLAAWAEEALFEFVRSAEVHPVEVVFGVAETLLLGIFTFLIGYYLTRDTRQFIRWLDGLIPRHYHDDMKALMNEINVIWGAFFRGQLILSLFVTVLVTGLSALIGLPQPLLMGVLAGIMEFLPSVGHAIWLITALIIALLEGSTWLPVSNVFFALIVIGVHTLYTQFDLNYLIPRIIGEHVHLHPLIVILGIMVGARVGGVLGVALAAPTIASLRVMMRYVYAMLLDLDPFPMVGPPAASKAERLAELARREALHRRRSLVVDWLRGAWRRRPRAAAPSAESLVSAAGGTTPPGQP